MNDGERFSRCDHPSCFSNGGRGEYCEVLGRDPEMDIQVIADYMDAILDANLAIAGTNLKYRTSGNSTYMQREFNILGADDKNKGWPLVETNVLLSRETTADPRCTRYNIATAWNVHQPAGDTSAPYSIRYCLEIWNGSAQATMTEYDFNIMDAVDFPPKNKLVDRPMTPYDYEQLFTLLTSIGAMQDGQALEIITPSP